MATHRGLTWPKSIERDLRGCADCGKIAGTTDPALLSAFYSVMIESPGLADELCACRTSEAPHA